MALVLSFIGVSASGEETARANPNQTLQALLDGNKRYVSSQMGSCQQSDAKLREKLATGQRPPAIILSCSDSRVPPEIIFDQGQGELFVIRVAGNVADPVVLGSVEYAAEHLGASLIMVLGHERCGAVTAAVDAKGKPHGNLGAIVSAIAPAAAQARKAAAGQEKAALIDLAVDSNVKLTEANLTKKSPVLAKLAKEGEIKIVGARYDLDDGRITLLDGAPASPTAAAPSGP
jgi:carbonic anhydrase